MATEWVELPKIGGWYKVWLPHYTVIGKPEKISRIAMDMQGWYWLTKFNATPKTLGNIGLFASLGAAKACFETLVGLD